MSSNPQQTFTLNVPVSTHLFRTGHGDTALGDGGDLELLFITSTNPVQLFVSAQSDGASVVALFEGTTVSSMGTPLTVVDFNRNTPRISSAVVFHTPTITGDGVELGSADILAGDKKDTFGASISNGFPFILAPITKYLVRLTNDSGGAARTQVSLVWLPTPRVVG